MQTIPLYHTTGISGFKITRIRTVANSGKTKTLEGQEDCQKGGGQRRGCFAPLVDEHTEQMAAGKLSARWQGCLGTNPV